MCRYELTRTGRLERLRRLQHSFQQSGEAGVKIVAAQRDEALIPLDPCAGDAGLPQYLKVMGKRRFRKRKIDGSARLFSLARKFPDDVQPNLIAKRIQHGR